MKSRRKLFPSRGPGESSAAGEAWFRGVRPLGLAGLAAALAASLALSVERLAGVGLPGCGPGAGCADAAASFFGSIRFAGLRWPVSHLGTAFFGAVAVGAAFGRESRWLARLGGAAAIFYLVVSAAQQILCAYCFAAHAGSLLYWTSAELRGAGGPKKGIPVLVAVMFGVFTLLLAGAEWAVSRGAVARAERDLAQTTREATASGERDVGSAFTGRYRLGPDRAPVRIVVFSDYQCRDCRWLEGEIAAVLASRGDVSYSPKHFPFCRDCNPHVPRTLHPNACWAARAAEAGGMLAGAEGFFRVHRWLFDRGGGFTDSELHTGLAAMGFDRGAFVAAMTSEAALGLVRADVEEAMSLGLSRTPLVYINGVELRGWQTPGALARAVAEVAAGAVERAGAPDRPATAIEKFIEDWASQPEALSDAFRGRHIAGEGRARVVIFGDYQDAGTALLDRAVRDLAARRADFRYEFAHFPADSKCNPAVSTAINPFACAMARAAEAAALFGGEGAFRLAHTHLLGQDSAPRERLASLADAIGLGANSLGAAMQDAAVRVAVAANIDAGRALRIEEVPTIFVNGRRVPRWKAASHEPGEILGAILDHAGR